MHPPGKLKINIIKSDSEILCPHMGKRVLYKYEKRHTKDEIKGLTWICSHVNQGRRGVAPIIWPTLTIPQLFSGIVTRLA